MINIKERLREFDSFAVNPKICKEAADHIEQQEAEIARLRKDAAGLNKCLNPRQWTDKMDHAWHRNIPDVHKAFEELRACVAPDTSTQEENK